jgi:hypothetical protein
MHIYIYISIYHSFTIHFDARGTSHFSEPEALVARIKCRRWARSLAKDFKENLVVLHGLAFGKHTKNS